MGHISCHCGNRLTNNYSPSETVGSVCGEIDKEAFDRMVENTIEEYVLSVKAGNDAAWLNQYFDSGCSYHV